MSETNVDLVLEKIGIGRTQVFMILTCGIICIYTANESIGIGLVTVAIAYDFNMTNVQISLLASAAFVGLVLSSHYWGYLSDKYGRRKEMLYSLGLSLISSIISILMPELYAFVVVRFLLGLFLSGAVVNSITYMTEFATIKTRPDIINYMSYAFPLGTIYVSVLAHIMHPLNHVLFTAGSFVVCVWRLNMMLHVAPGIIGFAALWNLPESAKFMISIGRTDRAYEILDQLCKNNRGEDLKSLGITSITQPNLRTEIDSDDNCVQRVWHDTVPLFKPPYLRSYLLCTLCMCAHFFVGNGLILWFIKLIQNLPDSHFILCDVIQMTGAQKRDTLDNIAIHKQVDYIDGIYLGCTFLVCCIGISILLMFMDRPHVQFIYAVLATICGFIVNFLRVRTFILMSMLLFLSLSMASVPLAASVIGDCVPTHLRGKAISLSFMFARLSVVFANILIGTCMTSHCLVAFNIFVLAILSAAILTCFMP